MFLIVIVLISKIVANKEAILVPIENESDFTIYLGLTHDLETKYYVSNIIESNQKDTSGICRVTNLENLSNGLFIKTNLIFRKLDHTEIKSIYEAFKNDDDGKKEFFMYKFFLKANLELDYTKNYYISIELLTNKEDNIKKLRTKTLTLNDIKNPLRIKFIDKNHFTNENKMLKLNLNDKFPETKDLDKTKEIVGIEGMYKKDNTENKNSYNPKKLNNFDALNNLSDSWDLEDFHSTQDYSNIEDSNNLRDSWDSKDFCSPIDSSENDDFYSIKDSSENDDYDSSQQSDKYQEKKGGNDDDNKINDPTYTEAIIVIGISTCIIYWIVKKLSS
ncbi:putative SP-containing membrane protein [Vairimorpha necatrix]|uniref:SP-containing membrane protein n=1 Tax=Vairimorpha necatrix TaxID=6039 RepID=A0AAX4JB68_9MICR